MQRGSESVYQYLRILFYGRVDEYVGDSVAGLLHSEPLLDGSLPEISVDHIIGSHPLMGLTASLVAKGCSSPRPPPNSVLQFLWSRSDPRMLVNPVHPCRTRLLQDLWILNVFDHRSVNCLLCAVQCIEDSGDRLSMGIETLILDLLESPPYSVSAPAFRDTSRFS